MAVSITRSYSARSWSTSSLPGGGGGGAMMSRAPGSVYGGAAGHRSMFSRDPSNDVALLCGDEKSHMQNLNDRLASYLEQVRNLEAANRKLEQQIKEHYEKKAPIQGKDLTVFFSTISDLRAQILRKVLEQHSIILQVDSARLAAGDFKNKCEMELNMRMAVEADITHLRSARDSLTLTSSDLETQIEGLKVELIDIKRNHEQELLSLRSEHGSVNVEVECAVPVDLAQVLSEMRQKYDTIVQKNHRELEQWFQTQVVVTQSSISTCSTDVKRSQTELSDMKKSHQSLLIELQAMLSKKSYLEQSLEDVCGPYSSQLSQLQLSIHTLEAELSELTVSIKQQATDYTILLDIKMRLEQEIAEYRRLLDGGHTKAVEIQEQVVVVEEHKPHIERRVVTIVENIVDGQVVSSTEDTEVTQIQ